MKSSNSAQNENLKTKAFLRENINRIDSWLDENKAYFNPFLISDKNTTFLYRKSYCEYALYLYVCENHSIPGGSHELKTQFFTHFNDPRFLELAKRNNDLFMAFGLPIAVANSLGRASKSHCNYFEQELQSQHCQSLELVPFRMMDYVFATQIYGCDKHIYPVNSLYRLSNYCRLPDPLFADESQTYALTHNIFYLTGMQARQDFLNVGLTFPDEAQQVLESLLLKYLSKQDLDVAIEVLVSLVLTGKCKRWHLDLLLQHVCQMMEQDRIIPGPVGRVGDDVRENHGEHFYSWAKNYHTMLVAAMSFRIIHDNLDDIQASPETSDLKLACLAGHMQRLVSDYNLPLLLTIIKSLENDVEKLTKMGLRPLLSSVIDFIDSQRRENGEVGYFHDEKNKAQSDSDNFEREILSAISKIEKNINWDAFKAA